MAKVYPIIRGLEIVDRFEKLREIMKSYDVIIIGRGLTALSTALHLARLGIRRTCLIAPPPDTKNCHSLLIQAATATLQDNVTRPVHNHGSIVTRELLRLARSGLSELVELLQTFKIDHAYGQVRRLALSDHETREMAVATRWLVSNGFPASLIEEPPLTCKSMQLDGAMSISFDARNLRAKLEKIAQCVIIEENVEELRADHGGVTLKTTSGRIHNAEVVVAACHTKIRNLIPELTSALVNHADQVVEFEVESGKPITRPGDYILVEHGQYWITHTYKGTIAAGGARHFRPWAGIEAVDAPVLENISAEIRKKIESIYGLTLSKVKLAHGLMEIHACDEIPIIGPMFGNSRVLVATGYMGSGATFACAAGKGLAEFIQHGKSTTIIDLFFPARLRSLPESN